MKFQGRASFTQYIPKNRKGSGIKIYEQCDDSGYTYDMIVYLGKDTQNTTDSMTATHTTVINLTCKVEAAGQKDPMDNIFAPHPHLLMT